MKRSKQRRGLRILAIVLAFFVLGGCVALYLASAAVYSSSFDYRCTTSRLDTFDIADFPAMERTRHTFPTLQGHTLVGYLYVGADGTVPKGAVVFAHGLGAGGQTGYLDIFDYLVRSGYAVFAYDATGNDESEGEVIGGLPQGFVDMDHAVTYAQSLPELQGLPFALMGYSWGGLSTVNTLNDHPEVKAAVAIAGCNRSMDLIEYEGRQIAGEAVKVLLPFASVYEFVTYGRYAFHSGMKGFAKSDCGVMIVHGALDVTVPPRYGYETYYAQYADDPRFTFRWYEDRGHAVLTQPGSGLDMELMGEITHFLDTWMV